MHMNYMKNNATPSVAYEQKSLSTKTTIYEGYSSSSWYYGYPYAYSNTNSNPYPYYGYPDYGGGICGYYGGGASPPPYGAMTPPPAEVSSSKLDLLSPPRASS